ncbi:MAG: maltose alpha-D-glucosyltransferase [Chitinispirillales bacterium]|jgi:maltose alpha-D-glucosyltransferase/alpha-amylase|nr:maltose alpha-D-glucosyltransferase [Chitinispirillales bacterium]
MDNKHDDDIALWYKDAVIYEVHVRAFGDSNGDGIGDFKGLTEKLDYLQSLGINTVWLLPFYPSPLKDDGYDIADYFSVHPDYGTLKDFKELLKAAHQRNIKVIVELVLNHTSDEHEWFKKARRAPKGSVARKMYMWSDTAERYKDVRIIFKDFEHSNWSWDHVAHAYYWHRFYSHQPDLNFDSPAVHRALFKVIDFWFEMGVDGLRLDAVPYLYAREGTNSENLKETHMFLKKLRAHVDSKFENRMLLAEANQWPEDAAEYFGDGDECHMAFHFPLMPRMFMAIQMEDSFPIVDILRSTPAIPPSCQWALFLRNHDELTLEMVTDEERDYMYRVYAKDSRAKINLGIRRRLGPLLSNDRRKIELMNILLFSLPGTPVIYYGDEIGMGDNYYLGDRNGVRTPMQWGPDRNAGFSHANPHKLFLPVIIDPEYHYEAVNVQNQEASYSSLLWWMRNIISGRRRFKAFSRGTLRVISGDNPKVLSFIRQYKKENVLVVVNLSRYSQIVNLDLGDFVGYIPEEVFGRNSFPIIKDTPYLFTLGPYDYFWLELYEDEETVGVEDKVSVFQVKKNWEEIFEGANRTRLEDTVLPDYLRRSRWFGAKSRKINSVKIEEEGRIEDKSWSCRLAILKVSYSQGAEERYLLPLSYNQRSLLGGLNEDFPQSVIADIESDKDDGILYDGTYDDRFHYILFNAIVNRRKIKGLKGEFNGLPAKSLKTMIAGKTLPIPSRPLVVEQSNTAILFNETLFLKLYRRLEKGINPELDILRYLGDRGRFRNIPPYAGVIEYRKGSNEPLTIAIMQGYVENSGNAWNYSLGVVIKYFERILSSSANLPRLPARYPDLMYINMSKIPDFFIDLNGELFLEMVSLLGKRTAQLHIELAAGVDTPQFVPESFSQLYQRSVYQSMQGLAQKAMRLLEKELKKMPEHVRSEAKDVLELEKRILQRMKRIVTKKITTLKTRVHGDYHLGQVLFTGKDFVIMDFEGEPARSLSERKLKKSPFLDVAGMIRSFHYVCYGALKLESVFREEDKELLSSWIEPWYHYTSGLFLRAYLDEARGAEFIPQSTQEIDILLRAFLLEKAVYELGYELNNRPDWVIIPLLGIKSLLGEE